MLKRIIIYTSILFLISCSLSESPNSPWHSYKYNEYLDRETIDFLVDEDYMDQLDEVIKIIRKSLYDKNDKEYKNLAKSYYQADSIKFKFLSDFYALRAKEDESVISLEYLKKPDFNDLLAIYLKLAMRQNEFPRSNGTVTDIEYKFRTWRHEVENVFDNLYSTHSLTAWYYNELFRTNKFDLPSNINSDELNLSKEESAILYLNLIYRFGRDIREQQKKVEEKDCSIIMELASKIPTINGQHFSEFNISNLKNFKRYHSNKIRRGYFWNENTLNIMKNTIGAYNECKNNVE